MKTRFLLSHKLKSIGWILFITGFILGVILMINDFDYPNWEMNVFPLIGENDIFSKTPLTWNKSNIADELAAVLLIVGGILVAFSKTNDEDEFISKIRMESLIWATYVNYLVLLVAILLLFDFTFFNVMVCNMFTILIFFIVRFHYMLYKSKKSVGNEE
jgi:hypothetical protein